MDWIELLAERRKALKTSDAALLLFVSLVDSAWGQCRELDQIVAMNVQEGYSGKV